MPTKELTRDDAITAMKQVIDPELGIDIWTLGLVYTMNITGTSISVKMTLTSPMCPFGPEIIHQLTYALTEQGFKKPSIEIVFDPPWQPSEELRALLGA